MSSRVSQGLAQLSNQLAHFLSGNGEGWADGRLSRRFVSRVALLALFLAVSITGGVLAGGWLAARHIRAAQARQHLDEYVGLGPRTGLTGDLSLQVSTRSLSVPSGEPVVVKLILTNTTSRTMMLNRNLDPVPGFWRSEQFPLKVIVRRPGHRVEYIGDSILLPPLRKKDFLPLGSKQSKSVEIDLSRGPEGGMWNVTAPGRYEFEVWYETYFSGQYIRTHAWTGMSNHAIVEVNITQPRQQARRAPT